MSKRIMIGNHNSHNKNQTITRHTPQQTDEIDELLERTNLQQHLMTVHRNEDMHEESDNELPPLH